LLIINDYIIIYKKYQYYVGGDLNTNNSVGSSSSNLINNRENSTYEINANHPIVIY